MNCARDNGANLRYFDFHPAYIIIHPLPCQIRAHMPVASVSRMCYSTTVIPMRSYALLLLSMSCLACLVNVRLRLGQRYAHFDMGDLRVLQMARQSLD